MLSLSLVVALGLFGHCIGQNYPGTTRGYAPSPSDDSGPSGDNYAPSDNYASNNDGYPTDGSSVSAGYGPGNGYGLNSYGNIEADLARAEYDVRRLRQSQNNIATRIRFLRKRASGNTGNSNDIRELTVRGINEEQAQQNKRLDALKQVNPQIDSVLKDLDNLEKRVNGLLNQTVQLISFDSDVQQTLVQYDRADTDQDQRIIGFQETTRVLNDGINEAAGIINENKRRAYDLERAVRRAISTTNLFTGQAYEVSGDLGADAFLSRRFNYSGYASDEGTYWTGYSITRNPNTDRSNLGLGFVSNVITANNTITANYADTDPNGLTLKRVHATVQAINFPNPRS